MPEKQIDALHMALMFTTDFPANMFSICKAKQYGSTVQLVAAGLNFAEQKSLVLSYKPKEALFLLLHLRQPGDIDSGTMLSTQAQFTKDRSCNPLLPA